MLLIPQITNSALQSMSFFLPTGQSVSLTIYFRPMQIGWFIQNLTYQNFILENLRITNSPNMLNQFRNQIPFGLACVTVGGREPSQQQDFSSGNSQLYVLTEDEAAAYAEVLTLGG